jgi:hypothetical protein
MILADTSIWVNHFRRDDPHLRQSLLDAQILSDLQRLPPVILAEQDEVLDFLDQHQLFGKGISWIDAHLLASARLSACRLWTGMN